MSKTVYLIGINGEFLQWCPGCLIRIEKNSNGRVDSTEVVARNPSGYKINLGCFYTPSVMGEINGMKWGEPGFREAWDAHKKQSSRAISGRFNAWIQAIISAPDGGLLRWDEERECMTGELAPEDAFAEEVAA